VHHKLTNEVQKRLVESLEAGNFITTATRAAGIGERTFFDWMNRGRREQERCVAEIRQPDEAEQPFVAFYEAIKETQAGAEEQMVAIIRNAALDDWKAAGWLLERKYPKQWGAAAKVTLEVRSEIARFLDHLQADLPPELYAAVLEAACSFGEAEGSAELLGEGQPAQTRQ
jgi:hypothetical protein